MRWIEVCKTSKLSRKGTVLFFSLLRKEPKVAQRVATLWTPRDGSKLYRIIFSWYFRLSSLNRYVMRPTFSDVLNRCERVTVHQTQDWCFPKMGSCTASSQGHVAFEKGSCSLSLLRWKFEIIVCWLKVLNWIKALHLFQNFVLSKKATYSHKPIASLSQSVITYCHQRNPLRICTKLYIHFC